MARVSQMPVVVRQEVSKAILEHKFPIYIHGTAGTGKTCMMGLVYAYWSGRAAWFQCSRLLRDLARCRVNPDHECQTLNTDGTVSLAREWQINRDIQLSELLCLDDVATKDLTDAQAEILKEILDERIGKATICTSNLSEVQLASAVDCRVASRLSSGKIITLIGADRRKEGASISEFEVTT
jgi:predicted ATPase